MISAIRSIFILVFGIMIGGCSAKVPIDEVFGTYVASYPFGTETLILNRDMTLVQRVQINGDPQAVVIKGSWSFDPSTSYVEFHDHLEVTDKFGKLSSD